VSATDQNLSEELCATRQKVAELEAQLAAANKLLSSYKAMLFGSRSEKASIVLDGQARLDLGDLVVITKRKSPARVAENRVFRPVQWGTKRQILTTR
jgi:hypothetical protein